MYCVQGRRNTVREFHEREENPLHCLRGLTEVLVLDGTSVYDSLFEQQSTCSAVKRPPLLLYCTRGPKRKAIIPFDLRQRSTDPDSEHGTWIGRPAPRARFDSIFETRLFLGQSLHFVRSARPCLFAADLGGVTGSCVHVCGVCRPLPLLLMVVMSVAKSYTNETCLEGGGWDWAGCQGVGNHTAGAS